MPRFHLSSATFSALGAAFLFGASTPFAKQLVGDITPVRRELIIHDLNL